MKSAKKNSPQPKPVMISIECMPTPIGMVQIIATPDGVREINQVTRRERADTPSPMTNRAAKAVHDYLSGKKVDWNFPLDIARGTPLQRKVWGELQKVPYGSTISYSELADRVGAPRAIRAVGSACGRNPLPLVVPCHRILAKGGTLGGFGWGLDVKRWLLDLEAGKQKKSA